MILTLVAAEAPEQIEVGEPEEEVASDESLSD